MKYQFSPFFILFLFFVSPRIVAQEDLLPGFDEQIITDRPDQTEAPQLTPRGWFQIETGTQREIDNDRVTKNNSDQFIYNTTLWKFGASRLFEFRVITDVVRFRESRHNDMSETDSVNESSGLAGVLVGSKIFIQKERGFIPNISFIGHLNLPYFGNSELRPDVVVPEFRFVFSHNPNKKLQISYNLGVEWVELERESTGIYTASLSYFITEKFNMYAEVYGFFKENHHPDHRWDAGFTYLLTDNFQLDISGGEAFTDISPDYYYSAGLSFRFATAKKFKPVDKTK